MCRERVACSEYMYISFSSSVKIFVLPIDSHHLFMGEGNEVGKDPSNWHKVQNQVSERRVKMHFKVAAKCVQKQIQLIGIKSNLPQWCIVNYPRSSFSPQTLSLRFIAKLLIPSIECPTSPQFLV